MKNIGLIGGMSWESTASYYKIINETFKEKLGGLHSGKILLYSVDFAEIEECQAKNEWEKSGDILGAAAKSLELAGADFLVLCTNTMHKVAERIQSHVKIPLLHIADATARELSAANIYKVALLGTKYTMTQEFYKAHLEKNGFEVVIPENNDIDVINDIIYNELCLGKISNVSREIFKKIIDKLKTRGAQAVILGCTEIGLLIKQSDSSLKVFDTTRIHAEVAALEAIKS